MKEYYTVIRITGSKYYGLFIFMCFLPLKITNIIQISSNSYTYIICLLFYLISIHKNCTGKNILKQCYLSIKRYIMKT